MNSSLINLHFRYLKVFNHISHYKLKAIPPFPISNPEYNKLKDQPKIYVVQMKRMYI